MSRTHDVTISAFDLDRLEAELEAERALADRLALALATTFLGWFPLQNADSLQASKALAEWKEARHE
jgi:hypothetical protein